MKAKFLAPRLSLNCCVNSSKSLNINDNNFFSFVKMMELGLRCCLNPLKLCLLLSLEIIFICLHLFTETRVICFFFIFICSLDSFFKKRFYSFIFRERGREGEKEGEKHQYVVASCAPPTGDLACNPGMCPRLGIKLLTLMTCRPALNPLSHTSQGWSLYSLQAY